MSPIEKGRAVRSSEHHNTIYLEDAIIVGHDACGGEQYHLRLKAPRIAVRAVPGSFVHLACTSSLSLRRPLSLLGTNGKEGSIDILYKVLGDGTRALSQQRVGASLSVLGPIGNGFHVKADTHALLIGGGVGIPPIVFLAERLLAREDCHFLPVVMMGTEVVFPFAHMSSAQEVTGVPFAQANQAMTSLERLGIANRLASCQGYEGFFLGHVTDLAKRWLASLPPEIRGQVEIFACGPEPMLRATSALATRYQCPAHLCLEEHMACGVGGCAGCTVLLDINAEKQMKRVCVDGPVFPAAAVYPSV